MTDNPYPTDPAAHADRHMPWAYELGRRASSLDGPYQDRIKELTQAGMLPDDPVALAEHLRGRAAALYADYGTHPFPTRTEFNDFTLGVIMLCNLITPGKGPS